MTCPTSVFAMALNAVSDKSNARPPTHPLGQRSTILTEMVAELVQPLPVHWILNHLPQFARLFQILGAPSPPAAKKLLEGN